MSNDERQFLLTAVWMFMRHGQPARARAVCAALVDDNPRDGVASVALAELMLDSGEAMRAIDTLRAADVPPELAHAAAFLEVRAWKMAGRGREAERQSASQLRRRRNRRWN